MRIVLAVFLAVCATLGQAAGPKYAVISLVGDSLLVVRREMATGSRIDRNPRTVIATRSPALDHTLILAVEDALRRRDPEARPILLATRDPELFTLQSRAVDGEGLPALLPALRASVANSGATHLIVAIKHRDEARLRVVNGTVGAGRIEGLGFYVDPDARMIETATGEGSQGYIAPFAYFSMALVDLESGAVLSEHFVRESTTVVKQQVANAWDALTAEEKVRILQALIRREVARAVPALLDAR